MGDNIDDQGRVHGDHCPWRNPRLGCSCVHGFVEALRRNAEPSPSRCNAWLRESRGPYVRTMSEGGASLQACVLVLLFAAAMRLTARAAADGAARATLEQFDRLMAERGL